MMNSRLSQLLNEEDSNTYQTSVELDIYSEGFVALGLLDKQENFDSLVKKQATIKWYCEMDYNSWGIDTPSIRIPDQKITISYRVYINDDGDTDEVTKEIEIKDVILGERKVTFPVAPVELEYSTYRGDNVWIVWFSD